MNDPIGTIRKAPPPALAFAIRCDQGPGNELCWAIVDAYGFWEMERTEDISDWPVIFRPQEG